jgi:pyruvate dehydrogenase E2 component (dihydrolipoamide acetyltransferase)
VAEGRLHAFGEVESKPLSRIKKISGANLHRNWVMIPHVTNCDEADITEKPSACS